MTFNKFVPCIVMNKIKYIIAVLFPLFLFINISQAQNFYSQVSSKKVQVGVPFEYSVVFTINTGNYTPPNFKDFDVNDFNLCDCFFVFITIYIILYYDKINNLDTLEYLLDSTICRYGEYLIYSGKLNKHKIQLKINKYSNT